MKLGLLLGNGLFIKLLISKKNTNFPHNHGQLCLTVIHGSVNSKENTILFQTKCFFCKLADLSRKWAHLPLVYGPFQKGIELG